MTQWHGCYNDGWKGFITPESFSHPAKFARGLIERIFDHCLERGYLERGSLMGDAFGGISTGGIIAAYRGLNWVGCELEPKFVKLAQDNFALHRHKLAAMGCPMPTIIQGDSRQFHRLVAGVTGIVSSPPFLSSTGGMGGILDTGYTAPNGKVDLKIKSRHFLGEGGDRTPGNIETLKEGTVSAVVASPPFEDSLMTKDKKFMGQVEKDQRNGSRLQGGGIGEYGNTEGQIGQDSGETYWAAVAQVYASCFQAIKPGGIIALVVKDYVKKGKRVPLCDDTVTLLEHTGFVMVERIHAMLVKETKHADMFEGETTSKTERKSFFRRLAEKKGSPAIDFEEVLIAKRP